MCIHAGALFYLVECIGFEFKFEFELKKLSLKRNRNRKGKGERKLEKKGNPAPKPTQPILSPRPTSFPAAQQPSPPPPPLPLFSGLLPHAAHPSARCSASARTARLPLPASARALLSPRLTPGPCSSAHSRSAPLDHSAPPASLSPRSPSADRSRVARSPSA